MDEEHSFTTGPGLTSCTKICTSFSTVTNMNDPPIHTLFPKALFRHSFHTFIHPSVGVCSIKTTGFPLFFAAYIKSLPHNIRIIVYHFMIVYSLKTLCRWNDLPQMFDFSLFV